VPLDIIYRFLIALGLSILIEIGVGFLFRFKGKDQIKVIIWMNILTNPTMNLLLVLLTFFFSIVQGDRYYIALGILEVIVVYIEYTILNYVFGKEYTKKKLLLISFCMNAASLVIGLLVFYLPIL